MPTDTNTDSNSQHTFIKSRVKKEFVMIPNRAIDATNISAISYWLWCYLESNADSFYPDTDLLVRYSGVSRPTILKAKAQLIRHRMIIFETIKNKYGSDRHLLITQDPDDWIDIEYVNKRSQTQVASKEILPAASKEILPAASKEILPIKIPKEKTKIKNNNIIIQPVDNSDPQKPSEEPPKSNNNNESGLAYFSGVVQTIHGNHKYDYKLYRSLYRNIYRRLGKELFESRLEDFINNEPAIGKIAPSNFNYVKRVLLGNFE